MNRLCRKDKIHVENLVESKFYVHQPTHIFSAKLDAIKPIETETEILRAI